MTGAEFVMVLEMEWRAQGSTVTAAFQAAARVTALLDAENQARVCLEAFSDYRCGEYWNRTFAELTAEHLEAAAVSYLLGYV